MKTSAERQAAYRERIRNMCGMVITVELPPVAARKLSEWRQVGVGTSQAVAWLLERSTPSQLPKS